MKLLTWMMGIAALFVGVSGRARASQITWGPATDITGDTDVVNTGSLVGAFTFETAAPSTTVNGVTFASMPSPWSSGNFAFNITGPEGFFLAQNSDANIASFNTLSSSYQTLLSVFMGTVDVLDVLHLQMNGLRPGDAYQFEWWFNYAWPPNIAVSATAGNSVSLISNTEFDPAPGGLGQYAVGSFIADGTSEMITFAGRSGGFLNAFQLRDDTVSTPEPASLTVLATGLLAVGSLRLRRRRAASAT